MLDTRRKKGARIIWIVISIIAVLSMVAFTVLPLLLAY
ncbi:MAG: hypothetical protein UY71_C0015G0008 [Parcubacteria group bacterium GW2011_GWB1_52_7]|nr:MAG: hypothetical protein UY71_C0015G0008 [Parcubacteria group bacterium GW2011_GWB1_52_7]